MSASEQGVLNAQWNAAVQAGNAEERRGKWAVVLRARIFKDGNKWCCLYGEDLQVGISGFGDTPERAVEDFETHFTMAKQGI